MLSLSIRKLCTHSQSSYGVYTLQAHVRFKIFKFSREIIFFIVTLSTHVSEFTLHTVIWFTLSKHMLGSKFPNFHERSFFHAYTLHTCFRIHSPYSYLVYTLQAHVRFKISKFSQKFIFFILTLSTHVSGFTLHTVIWLTISKHMLGSKFSNFHERSLFHAYTLHTCFRVHSPYSYLVYTLQAHVRFKISKFSQKFIFFILTLSTHVSGFTLHTVIWLTISKHMLGSKFSNFHERSLFHAYTLHTCFRVHSPYSYLVYTLQAHVRFNTF